MSTKILDHIPHLTPPGTLAESVEAFEKLGFTWVRLIILIVRY